MEGVDLNISIYNNSGDDRSDYNEEVVARDVEEDVAAAELSLNSHVVEEIDDVDHVSSAIVVSHDSSLVGIDDRVPESLEVVDA
ncbi:OLC1v1012490C1 [Oldenlandia corymbosa var. corymbosa]|uniref:OLC1v1012490C1 n=1 Tax=Oldenlandia corymbosa var. corymbosa TaxID=529605 RepID=A0AAV1DZK8_OLDCO|nr:OLC1v1012490C1 [Oldenlandia corymbosa var. corymbosa]